MSTLLEPRHMSNATFGKWIFFGTIGIILLVAGVVGFIGWGIWSLLH